MAERTLLERIAAELAARSPRRAEAGSYEAEAAVALMLRPSAAELEFLAIKRAEAEGDPWSGHMALPGGRRDATDGSLWDTAARETLEEVGVDLRAGGRVLGQLDDVYPRTNRIPAIAISPFVVAVGSDVKARTSTEVEDAVWLPLRALVDEANRGTLKLDVLPEREFPTIEYGGHVIWGLTLAILQQLAGVLERIGYGGVG